MVVKYPLANFWSSFALKLQRRPIQVEIFFGSNESCLYYLFPATKKRRAIVRGWGQVGSSHLNETLSFE